MSHINSDTASPHSDEMRINEGASAEELRHVRDWLDRLVRPIATIEQRDELDRYSYEWRETGECYEETDGDVTYTVPVLRSVSYGRDEDVQAAAEALGFDCYCDECEHVVDWLMRQYDAVSKQLRALRPDTGLPKGITDARKPAAPSMCREEADVVYVGVFDGEEPLTGSPWFPEGWLPDGFDEVLDEGGVGAVWQEYGEAFAWKPRVLAAVVARVRGLNDNLHQCRGYLCGVSWGALDGRVRRHGRGAGDRMGGRCLSGLCLATQDGQWQGLPARR